MIARAAYLYRCDRPDCDATVAVVRRAEEPVGPKLTGKGWTYSTVGRLRHFCPRHSQPAVRLVGQDAPLLRSTS